MDIISRLKLFLEQNGISNSQFADTCGIPRPTLSQLLNGRNKKVSDEVISKIHAAYPALNILWLMFGDGDMFVDNAPGSFENGDVQNLSKTPQNGNRFFGGPGDDFQPSSTRRQQQAISFEEQNPAPRRPTSTPLSDTIQNIAKSVGRGAQPSGRRQIVNIMIFYDDNSFESITPMR